jgi:hypothetical protein
MTESPEHAAHVPDFRWFIHSRCNLDFLIGSCNVGVHLNSQELLFKQQW